jgi:hypothetical protein
LGSDDGARRSGVCLNRQLLNYKRTVVCV